MSWTVIDDRPLVRGVRQVYFWAPKIWREMHGKNGTWVFVDTPELFIASDTNGVLIVIQDGTMSDNDSSP